MKPMPRIIRLLLASLLPSAAQLTSAQELSLSWAMSFGHRPGQYGSGETGIVPLLLSDTNGFTRVYGTCHGGAGTFIMGTNVFPATKIDGTEYPDIYMARLDIEGKLASVKLLPTTGGVNVSPVGVALDPTGNVVLFLQCGGLPGSTLAGTPVPYFGGLMMVKLDANDEVLSATVLAPRPDPLIYRGGMTVSSIAVDKDDNIVIGGSFWGIYDLDGVLLQSSGSGPSQPDLIVAKFEPDGTLLWVRTAGAVEPPGVYLSDAVRGVVTDSAGNVFIGGTIVNGASFDGQVVNTIGDYDVFVAKYDPDGNVQWVFATDSWRFQGLQIGHDDKPVLVHVDGDSSGATRLRVTALDNSGNPVSAPAPVLVSTGSYTPWIPFVGMEVGNSNELLFVASAFPDATLHFGSATLSMSTGEERLVFGGSLNLNGTWNWLRPIARPHSATNSTPERYFLPGLYAWPDMRGFTAWQGRLRCAGIYLSPEPLPMGDGTLPASVGNYRQFFIAELAVKPLPPRLTITTTNPSLALAWPSSSTNFVLQSATTLANGGDWQDLVAPSTQVNGLSVVTVGATNKAGFFRLRSQ